MGPGGTVGDYRAPLFLAWQLTNRCTARCLHCCEESGPDLGWRDELTAEQALAFARKIGEAGIVEVAFGGGEPTKAPHFWRLLDVLHQHGVALKIETDGLELDVPHLARLEAECIQISTDGATPEIHAKLRPGGDLDRALGNVRKLRDAGLDPEVVFVPTRLNAHQAKAAMDRAAQAGASRFITGPLMRLGRAGQQWDKLALSPGEWAQLREQLAKHRDDIELVAYPHDIVEEIRLRAESPQAMLLVVPNGKVKLLNALPFSCGDVTTDSLEVAFERYMAAWRHPRVRDFIATVPRAPGLLRHANEVWPI